MARVVQRRNAPPYLLIVVVMLLVVAIALAAIFYNKYSKADQIRADALAKVTQTSTELRDSQASEAALIMAVTGRTVTAAVATEEAKQCLELPLATPYAGGGLVEVAKDLIDKEVGKRDARIAELEVTETQLNNSLTQKKNDLKNLETRYEQKQQADADTIKAAEDILAGVVKAKEDQLQQAIKEKDTIIDTKAQQITVLNQDMNKLRSELARANAKVRFCEENHGGKKIGKPDTLTTADGKIASVVPEQGVCYVNLGRKDRVNRGLTFSVYSARTGVSNTEPGKAKIVVINVGELTSECRIVAVKPEDPIMENDLVVNLVYDTTRVHKFVVEGDFDLYGRGRPDPLGKDRVESLIKRWGAEVCDDVTVDVDCVVMGSAPTSPTKPATDAPPQEWELYRLAMSKYQHYHDVKEAARKLRITIMNTTQFLAYSGLVLGASE